MNNRVYTANMASIAGVVPAANANYTFEVNNVNCKFKIISISFDINIWETVSGLPLNLSLNNTQNYWLNVYGLPAPRQIAQIFTTAVIPAGQALNNGNLLLIKKIGQLKYDSFWVDQNLRFDFFYLNNDLLLNFSFSSCVVVEISDIEKI